MPHNIYRKIYGFSIKYSLENYRPVNYIENLYFPIEFYRKL